MTTEERLDALERDLRQLRGERTILSDSIQVLNRAHDVHTDSLASHAKWIEELNRAQAKTEEQLRESGRQTDERIAKLVTAIGEFMHREK